VPESNRVVSSLRPRVHLLPLFGLTTLLFTLHSQKLIYAAIDKGPCFNRSFIYAVSFEIFLFIYPTVKYVEKKEG